MGCGVDGDVIEINYSSNFILDNLKLYGCGTQGIDIDNSTDITVNDSEIYDCSNGAVSINSSFNINFNNSIFRDNDLVYRSIFDIDYSKNIYICLKNTKK